MTQDGCDQHIAANLRRLLGRLCDFDSMVTPVASGTVSHTVLPSVIFKWFHKHTNAQWKT